MKKWILPIVLFIPVVCWAKTWEWKYHDGWNASNDAVFYAEYDDARKKLTIRWDKDIPVLVMRGDGCLELEMIWYSEPNTTAGQ